MPEMLDREPIVIIRELLAEDWDAANTSYSDDPRVHTGWWDWGRDEPVVTVTNPQDNPVSPGTAATAETGYTYMTGDGRAGQRRNGYCLVNVWSGSFGSDALASEGEDGGRLSPKILAGEMRREARRILLSYQDGTRDDDGNDELSFVSPGTDRRIVESDDENEHPTLFRYEIEARFGYDEES